MFKIKFMQVNTGEFLFSLQFSHVLHVKNLIKDIKFAKFSKLSIKYCFILHIRLHGHGENASPKSEN